MLTRRNFLKLGGIAAGALGAGYSTGKLVYPGLGSRFSVHGFIPADELYIKRLALLFRKKIRSSTPALVYGDSRIGSMLRGYDNSAIEPVYSRKGSVIYLLQRQDQSFSPDLVISDNKTPVYIPEDDFSYSFFQLRNDMKKLRASYIFTAEYKEESLFNSLFSPSKNIIIENEKGTAEVLKASAGFKDIAVDGAIGKTHITLSDGIVKVSQSCCRNKICEHTLLSGPQDFIACAPNKIIIRYGS